MKKILKLAIIVAFISLNSCSDFLDTKPEDFLSPKNYYNTESDLNTALTGVYDALGNRLLYGDNMLGSMSLDADEAYYTRNNLFNGPEVNNVSTTDAAVSGFWSQCYIAINRANLLLENIDKAQDISDANRDAIEGEALFLRANYYLMLVSNFGDVPLVLNSLPNAENTNISRTPAKEVYDYIIDDMIRAEALVKPISTIGFGGRVSKSAVRGVLARACLYAAGNPINDVARYVDARNWAKKVKDDPIHALNPDYSQIFINYAQDKYDIKESIWEVEFFGNNLDAYQEGGRVGNNNGIRNSNTDAGYTYGFIGVTGKLFDLFEPNVPDNGLTSPDLRRDWSIAPYTFVNGFTKGYYTASQIYERDSGKWRREYELVSPKSKNNTPQNFPILRYSDVLLMFAEADNEVNGGPTLEAYNAINLVRRRAYGKLLAGATNINIADLSGLNKDTFRQKIQDERSRELSFECLRKRDLVRWGNFLPVMKEIQVLFDSDAPSSRKFGALGFKNVTARDVVWPIPARELGLNKLLTQNIGW